jgi:hypothetical protein
VLGYLAHEAVACWGDEWLSGGRMIGSLAKPVFDGESITVASAETAPDRIDAGAAGADGDNRATATMTLESPEVPSVDEWAVAGVPDPDDRPPASRDRLAPGTTLATLNATYRADRAPAYLDELSEEHPAFTERGLAQPGWLLRFSNWVLSETVRLGPWIHVASDARFLRSVDDGDRLEVRGKVKSRNERKGHEFVEVSVLYLVEGEPVLEVDQLAIWQPRPARLTSPEAERR